MKLIIVKAIISWLTRRHFRLLYEAVVPEGKHIQGHRARKARASYADISPDLSGDYQEKQTADLINHYSPVGQTATSGVDE